MNQKLIKRLAKGEIALYCTPDTTNIHDLTKVLKAAFPKDHGVPSVHDFIRYYHTLVDSVYWKSDRGQDFTRNICRYPLHEFLKEEETVQPLPEKWFIKCTEENVSALEHWSGREKGNLGDDMSGYILNCKEWSPLKQLAPYVEITTKQFLEQVYTSFLKQQPMDKSKIVRATILPEEALRIVDCACDAWTRTLAKKWGELIVRKKNIRVYQDFYEQMREACTLEQHIVFDEIFGKDVVEKFQSYKDIKTFEDALEWCDELSDSFECRTQYDTPQQVAFKKLEVICKAIRFGEEMGKYYPAFSDSVEDFKYATDYAPAYSDYPVNLKVKTAEKASYLGKQFTDIYKIFIFG